MSEPKLISPLLDRFAIGSAISDHHGVRCYPAMREDSDEKYIVKVISIPASERQLEALLISGAYPNAQSAQTYFESLVNDVESETQVLRHLAKLEGFLAYEDYQVVPTEDGVGFEIYLLGSYKNSLAKYFSKKPMTHLGAVNLGIDLCAAMTVCRQAGCLYIDLKPENIFITEDGRYQVGDLGFIPLSSLKYSSVADKYRSSYTAPEMADPLMTLNESVDIYAIGLILYQAYNNNTLPFEGSAPNEILPPPLYADYEMAEIILKACAPDPKDRWADPKELGQALVAYMQRNGANDTPIVPPSIPAADIVTVEEPVADEDHDETEQNEELDYISDLTSDETAPSDETGEDLNEIEMSEELSDILAQADELLAHELPAPAVAPDPIEIPIPAPIRDEKDDEESEDDDLDVPEFVAASDSDTPKTNVPFDTEEVDGSDEEVSAPPKKGKALKAVFGWIITLALLAGLAVGGYYFYSNYYLQNIDALTLDGQDNNLDILISSQIDESLLTVYCTDTYGTVTTAPVVNGVASFKKLNPGALYTIHVQITGFHQLTGQTSASYATPPETNILDFNAAIGTEDGSVILSFTVDGQDTSTWYIVYSAEDEEEKTVSFSGHSTVITGLTVEKEYTFRLVPEVDLYLIGNTELTFVAPKLVSAENLEVTGFDGKDLQVSWTAPADATVPSWTVRCYNDNGYDVTLVVQDCTATFENVDTATSNTIEVTAEGMTQCVRTFISANPISITEISSATTDPNVLSVSWDFVGTAPEGGWLVFYSIADTGIEGTVQSEESVADIRTVIPGATYEITIQAATGATLFNGTYTTVVPNAPLYEGNGASAANMYFSMCLTPEVENWDKSHLSDEDYMTTFAVGDKASFLVYLSEEYNISYEEIITLYVIRDEAGKIVTADTQSRLWFDMWYRGYCELDIPVMPQTPGNYTIDIYFNGGHLTNQSFTIE